MITLDVDPQTTVTAPRPSPDEVIIFTCDAAGAKSWIKLSKTTFSEMCDPSWLRILDDSAIRLYETGKQPDPRSDLR